MVAQLIEPSSAISLLSILTSVSSVRLLNEADDLRFEFSIVELVRQLLDMLSDEHVDDEVLAAASDVFSFFFILGLFELIWCLEPSFVADEVDEELVEVVPAEVDAAVELPDDEDDGTFLFSFTF